MSVKLKLARAVTRATGYELRPTRPAGAAATGNTASARKLAAAHQPAAAKSRVKRDPLSEPPPRRHTEESLADLLVQRRAAGDRLVQAPVFILSSVRSGSTLVRVMLDSHSRIYSPHELHLRNIRVTLTNKYVAGAMGELGLDARELKYLLWDRVLHRELTRRGKQILVNKTPSDSFIWRAIIDCWPDAKFIFLLRHPAAVVDSWNSARTYWTREEATADVLKYVTAVEQARTEHGGLSVRYEDITADPETQTRRICEFIGVDWEPGMLTYGQADHGDFKPGLGDWSSAIKSGTVQSARPLPPDDTIPEPLRAISAAWGYLHASATA